MWTQQVRVAVVVSTLLPIAFFLFTTAAQRSDLLLLLLFVLTCALPGLLCGGIVQFVKWDRQVFRSVTLPMLFALSTVCAVLLLGTIVQNIYGRDNSSVWADILADIVWWWGKAIGVRDPFQWTLSQWIVSIICLAVWTIIAWQIWIVIERYLRSRPAE